MNNQKLLRQLALLETDYDFYHSVLVQCNTDAANALLLAEMKTNSKQILDLLQQNIKLLSIISSPKIAKV